MYISLFLSCIFRLSQFLFVVLRCTLFQQWQKPTVFVIHHKQDVQSILEGFSIDDSERSLPQVPNESLGLSSVSQTLSSSFNRLRRGITNRIGKHTSQPQDQTSKEINVEQLSPTSLRTHFNRIPSYGQNFTCAKQS